jgi:hypothetical protein
VFRVAGCGVMWCVKPRTMASNSWLSSGYWVYSAAKMADRAAELEDALARDGRLLVKGSMGQDVSHPLLAEVRQLHMAINQTLARLKTEPPEASGLLGIVGANPARRAANARWRPGSRA